MLNATDDDSGARDTQLATKNLLELGASLLFTWGIALAMRFWLPRHLGPERFGTLSFADAFAATFFVALGLGVDPYVRKEVSVRPAHASEFFGGMLVLRAAVSAGVVAAMVLAMDAMHRPPEVRRLVCVFALAQFFVTSNATLSALLQAKGSVGGASVLAIATKIVWALGVLLALWMGAGLSALAGAYLLSEAIETAVLFALARRHLDLRFRIDVRATKVVLLLCLPHYLNTVAITTYGKLDLTLLELRGGSREVGWYAAASAIASCALLATPLIGWVMMPTLARAASRSREELFARLNRSTELILNVAIPAALFLHLGADLAVRLLFGAAFAPARTALCILAPTFVITYVAIVFAITLIMLDRAWTLTAISIAGLVVNVGLNLVLIPRTAAWLGDGGGGAGSALAMLGTEIFVTTTMASFVGRGALDRRTLAMIAKGLAAVAVAVAVDRAAAPLGWARLCLAAAAYLAVVVMTGALRLGDLAAGVQVALRRKAPALAGAERRIR
jgi:O-antigen/teichoic acid export membrane protein